MATDTKSKNNLRNNFRQEVQEIAHEFQTPLSILKANLETLAPRGTDDEKKALYVAQITLDRLSRLVKNLLNDARFIFSTVNLTLLLKEAHEDCVILAEDKDIVFSFESDPVFVSGDPDKLKEVLLNLLSNALKHTPPGGSIHLSAHEYAKNEVEVIVADTGRGIAPENIERIFERFYQIDKGKRRKGNGLGLHICQKIIEAHNGIIFAESELGQGSRFVIRLPISSKDTVL